MKKLLFLIFSCVALSFGQRPSEAEEYTLKAAYIERFSRFIEWLPKDNPPKTIRFGIIGNREITTYFKRHFQGKEMGDKSVDILTVSDISDISGLDIVYITEVSPWNIKEIIDSTGGKALIIGDKGDMAESGAVISFIIRNDKLRFRINTTVAKEHNIKISSYLLELAEIVSLDRVRK